MADTDDISFGPCRCGHDPPRPSLASFPWAAMAGYGDSDCVAWFDGDTECLRRAAPAIGDVVRVRVAYPFRGHVGEMFWSVFNTEAVERNGYIDRAADLAEMRLVRSLILEVPVVTDRSATARVEVMDVLSPGDLLARTPMPGDISRVAASLGYGYETCQSGELRFGESNFEGDLGAWVVLADAADGMHLLIFGEWGAHENFAYAGNRLLSASEAKAFG